MGVLSERVSAEAVALAVEASDMAAAHGYCIVCTDLVEYAGYGLATVRTPAWMKSSSGPA